MRCEQSNSDMTAPWNIGEFPFFFQYGHTPTNRSFGLPDRLPFFLTADIETGLIRQRFNEEVAVALERAYEQGSMLTGAMDSAGIGQDYALDFLKHIQEAVPTMAGKRVLEIGCGTGYLLSLLQNMGADVRGIEPGPQGENAEDRFGVKVIRDFFPCPEVSGVFDIVIAYGVLEHLSEPERYLREIKRQLAPRGILILAVPNCEPYFQAGDLSCLIHEHWSYFTSKTLKALLSRVGFSATITEAGFGGSLYCSATVAEGDDQIALQSDGCQLLMDYRQNSMQMLNKLASLLNESKRRGQSVGIYVAGRLANALALMPDPDVLSSIRFFDDNEALHGRYFPCFPLRIEGWADFLDRPTEIVLIASNTFGHRIRERIEKASKSRVVGWDELYG